MSYKLQSFKTSEEHDVEQWNHRSLEGELQSFKGRTLTRIFDHYLNGGQLRILEGGCGFGAWCEWFQERGHQVIGIEYDKNVVGKAKQFKSDIAVELGDITNLNYPDGQFDAYISLGVIEHFEHGPQQALKEAHRILKAGGLAFITTPYVTVLRRFVSHPIRSLYFLIRKIKGHPNYFWEYRFTKKELRSFLEEAGFEVIHSDVDDYEPTVGNRHIGLWADWFFLRKLDGEIWELNSFGKLILRILRFFPPHWFCSGLHLVARAKKNGEHRVGKKNRN
ncbi:methyltransferase domain-containing protein [candidate division KSB1 bacterium]|nr:methyltransferase domain-containing protein [candidate division KSB1 bacterium]NIR68384.1 methyltransferase domain-containing protein [candidate division KSB1 bacterium]NIS25328.1 methyltransferase domain-containing protein [candidate division KSB1 bacterium]NIT72239.1 methyltransferase domain-containing protein [candidate division KSB1 bacterium]NIU26047.1 methyltransferase domain-containing protein [candidate division KSB1 bacterium]